VKTETGYIRL